MWSPKTSWLPHHDSHPFCLLLLSDLFLSSSDASAVRDVEPAIPPPPLASPPPLPSAAGPTSSATPPPSSSLSITTPPPSPPPSTFSPHPVPLSPEVLPPATSHSSRTSHPSNPSTSTAIASPPLLPISSSAPQSPILVHQREPDLLPCRIPTNFTERTNLVSFFASNVSLTGTIPDIFASLPNFQNYKLSYNTLTGTLPPPFLACDIPNLGGGGSFFWNVFLLMCIQTLKTPLSTPISAQKELIVY